MKSNSIRVLQKGAVALFADGQILPYEPRSIKRPFIVINPDEMNVAAIRKILASGFYEELFCAMLKLEEDSPVVPVEAGFFYMAYRADNQLFINFRNTRGTCLVGEYDRLSKVYTPEKILKAIFEQYPQGLEIPRYAEKMPQFMAAINALPEYLKIHHQRNYLHLAVPEELSGGVNIRELAAEALMEHIVSFWEYDLNAGLIEACKTDMPSARLVLDKYRQRIGRHHAVNEPAALLGEIFSMEHNSLVAPDELAKAFPKLYVYFCHFDEMLQMSPRTLVTRETKPEFRERRIGDVVEAPEHLFKSSVEIVSGEKREGEKNILYPRFNKGM